VERGAGRAFEGRCGTSPYESFSVCAAAAMYRKSALEGVALPGGPFDEDFFSYYEDYDLGWRLHRAGYRALVVPAAQAYHVRGGSASAPSDGRSARMIERLAPEFRLYVMQNRLLLIGRNQSSLGLLPRLPGILLWEMALWAFLARLDRATLKRHIRLLPRTIGRAHRKRREALRPVGHAGRKPVIAIAITKLELGGAQQVALAVAKRLRELGSTVIFVTGNEGSLRSECEAIPGLVRYFSPHLVREVRPGGISARSSIWFASSGATALSSCTPTRARLASSVVSRPFSRAFPVSSTPFTASASTISSTPWCEPRTS